MKPFRLFLVTLIGLFAYAGDVPAPLKARLVKSIITSSNIAAVTCSDATMAAEFGKIGVAVGDSKVAYGANAAEVKALAASGKLVICSSVAELAAGGSLAIVEEGGKPKVYMHLGNVSKSGAALGDTVLKIATRI